MLYYKRLLVMYVCEVEFASSLSTDKSENSRTRYHELRNEFDAYEKDWPQKALRRDEWKDGREAFTLQWEDHG